jgi:F-type H+-transporting ATPase subunit a
MRFLTAPFRAFGTWYMGLKGWQKVAVAFGIWAALIIGLYAGFGSAGKNQEYQPQNEFKLDPWINMHIGGLDMSINKAVLYLFLTAFATCAVMIWIARKMQQRPNKVQTAVEAMYDLANNNITRGNLPPSYALKWFPFIATLFFYIWFSNLIGYIPLPTNSEETVMILGFDIPSFALYAATANIGVPLVLTLVVWFSYHVEGIRAQGFKGYFASFVPAGTPKALRPLLFIIEVISHFVRIISLSVRLFANLLAGHLLILFMGGGMVVLIGVAALGAITLPVAIVFFIFEVVLIATLQAFIFATLTAIYLGGAVEGGH